MGRKSMTMRAKLLRKISGVKAGTIVTVLESERGKPYVVKTDEGKTFKVVPDNIELLDL